MNFDYYDFFSTFPIMFFITVFAIGTCMGSFLNVCIWRIPRGESIVHPPSRCPKCEHSLSWYENFPIFGWLLLKGKCKSCFLPISPKYILMELLVGLLFIVISMKSLYLDKNFYHLLPYFVVSSLCVTTYFIDLDCRIIPNLTTYPSIIFGIIYATACPQSWSINSSHFSALINSSFSALIVYISLSIFAFIAKKISKQDAFGGGDIKFLTAIASIMGLQLTFFTLLFGALSGSIYGLIIMVKSKNNLKTAIPLGPFLAVTAYISIFVSEPFFNWYFNLMNAFK
jgi:leader peptidase (prepilin peptidase)/N-methyltransferase